MFLLKKRNYSSFREFLIENQRIFGENISRRLAEKLTDCEIDTLLDNVEEERGAFILEELGVNE